MKSSTVGLGVLFGCLALGCPGAKDGSHAAKLPTTLEPPEAGARAPMSKPGLGFRLSDADAEAGEARAKAALAEPLNAEDTQKLLARIPPIKSDPDDTQSFALRAKSIPAPRPGETIKNAFPPTGAPTPAPTAAPGELRVTRHEPEGNVALAPYLTVTFSAPMVPVTSHQELSAIPIPIKLAPETPGKWRWIGTQTVMFQPDGRFPMSTDYTVDIDAGTKSATGAVLAQAQHYKFSTATPTLRAHGPGGDANKLDPLIYARFDQAIDPEALIASVIVTQNKAPVKVRLATAAEMADDTEFVRTSERRVDEGPLSLGIGDYHGSAQGQYAGDAAKTRMIAMKPVAPFAKSAAIEVRFSAGAPGAEGPKRTPTEQKFGFTTHGPLRFVKQECWGCAPSSQFNLEYSNPLDVAKFDKTWVTVDPPILDMSVGVSGRSITVLGHKKGRSVYKVTVAKALTDTFDETLDQDDTHSFSVGPADTSLFGDTSPMIVVDPAESPPAMSVFSVNEGSLHVRLYSVTPNQYPAYEAWRQDWDNEGKMSPVPGKLAMDKVVQPAAAPDDLTETKIDLRPALSGDFGQVLAIIESTRPVNNRWEKVWIRQWLQVTHLGLQAVADRSDLIVWTTGLADGAPVADATVSVAAGTATVGKATIPVGAEEKTTGADGTARMPAGKGAIVATKGKDTTFLPNGLVANEYQPRSTRFFTMDDRKMYKPGEDVHVKGWVREVGYAKGGDVGLLPDSANQVVKWVAHDARGAEISKGDAHMSALGGFDFVATTPKNANLGYANISLSLAHGSPGQQGSHSFEIQEFRRPEFEVTASTSEGPNFVGGHAVVTALAKYYAGGGLPNAEVNWSVQRSTTTFVPPNRQDYVFGKREWDWRPPRGAKVDAPTSGSWIGHTDSQGAHRLRVDFDPVDPAYPMSLSLNARVMDVNRQAWAASATLLVHTADVYVGLKLVKPFVEAGQSIDVDTLVADLEGKTSGNHLVTVKSTRLTWEQARSGSYEETEVDEQLCSVTSTDAPVRCTFPAKKGGQYRLTAVVSDATGRKSQTVTRVWVMDKDAPRDRNVPQSNVEMIADKKAYAAGDTAEILVVAPFAPAEGMLVVARQGILSTERFRMTRTMQTFTVKIDESMTPNVHAIVLLAGSMTRSDASGNPDEKLPKRPAHATGTISLPVPPTQRTLAIEVHPRESALAPGARTTIDVDVKDAHGGAVADAEVAVMVVDESVLALSRYQLPDPLTDFYPLRGADVAHAGTRESISLANPDQGTFGGGSGFGNGHGRLGAPGGGGGGGIHLDSIGTIGHGAAAAFAAPAPMAMAKAANLSVNVPSMPNTPIAMRSDFAALAAFEPAKQTDARGHVEVPIKLPDNLTRYRIMAIAVARENEFGSRESTLTVRLPLMVRPSAPRFLTFGDKFELPVVLQNQTDKPMNVAVAVRAHNAKLTDSAGKHAVIAPNDRVEVRFLATTEKPGKARFQLAASSEDAADASDVELPVWTPATTEAFATYGVIDTGAIAQPVKMPTGVFTQFGGLDVTTSSTALQGLTDAVVYLVHYPFECNEQLASRMLAVAALRDVLSAFDSKDLPPASDLEASMAQDLEKLRTRQKPSGGWAFWWGDEWPFVSIHVAHAIARAEAKGYKVDATMKQRAVTGLRDIESRIPFWYDAESRRGIVAYSLYVRRLLKDADPARARRLIVEYGGVEKMNLEAAGWIWPTLSEDKGSAAQNAELRRLVGNRVTETAGTAHFVTSYGDGDYLLLHSDRRADAVLLEAMMIDEPSSDLIPKLVKGLLAQRKAGKWGSTQENAFVLLALDRYFEKYEAATPAFVARVWLGDKYAGDHAFKGRSTEYGEVDIPMSFLADAKAEDLTVAKEGVGRLYFRIGMQYAPTDLRPPPADQGFTVARAYEPVDDNGDVTRDANGVWHFKAGKTVRVRVTMIAPARRYHVALVDPMPAGVEPMNAALAVTGTIPQGTAAQKSADRYWYWHSTWYEHQNLRDERAEAFSPLVWEGVHEYVYTVRATTPGTFVAGPPKAEEMYSPEVFGRGAGDIVIVE